MTQNTGLPPRDPSFREWLGTYMRDRFGKTAKLNQTSATIEENIFSEAPGRYRPDAQAAVRQVFITSVRKELGKLGWGFQATRIPGQKLDHIPVQWQQLEFPDFVIYFEGELQRSKADLSAARRKLALYDELHPGLIPDVDAFFDECKRAAGL